MSAADWAERQVAQAPEITEQQAAALARLLAGGATDAA